MTDAAPAPTGTAPGETTTTPAPTGTAPSPTGTTPAAPPPTTTTEIGEGDSEAAVIPVDLSVDGATITPAEVAVPAFLTIELSVRSADGREHAVRITTPRGPVTLNVPAGGAASTRIEGLPKGDYLVALDGQPTDTRLRVGVEPGP